MVDPPASLGIPPKGLPVGDRVSYADLVAKGKLRPLDVEDVRTYGAAGDGVHDDSKALQRAVDATEKKGGGAVYLPPGTYILHSTITLPAKSVYIYGAGLATIIKGDADPLIQSSTDAVNSNLVIANLKVELTKTSAAQVGVKILLTWSADPKASLVIDNVWFFCDGHADSVELFIQGVREGNISNCWFESTTDLATGIEMRDRAMNLSVSACQFITLKRGMFLWRSSASLTVEGIRVIDCSFIGGADAIEAEDVLSLQVIGCMIDSIGGTPLNLTEPLWHTIVGNWLHSAGAGKTIIKITGPAQGNRIAYNVLSNTNETKGDGIRVEATPGAVREFSIIGNAFGGLNVAVNFGLSGGFVDRMKIVGNDFDGPDIGVHLGTTTPHGNNVVADNAFLNIGTAAVAGGDGTNRVHDNVGWVTENNGWSTILAANTSVVVTHGMSGTPQGRNITIEIGTNPTNDIGFFYITNITSTQFTVNVRNSPGSDLAFGWQVIRILS